uniref:Uncharacterized protein n=1 Tax=viral metagenome TaxID=1070528 RepID=A0A6M3JZS0_9ZZZZ
METNITEESWMGKLIRKYEDIEIDKLDKANEIICDALDKITSLDEQLLKPFLGENIGKNN